MLHRIPLALFVMFTLLVLAVDAQEKKDDKKAIQGTWSAKKDDKSATITFAAEKFTLEFGGKKVMGTFKIDASKTPKQLDLTITEGFEDDTKKYEGKTSKSIYELEGDKFKWLAPQPGNDEHPTAFPLEGEQTKSLYLTFDREKK